MATAVQTTVFVRGPDGTAAAFSRSVSKPLRGRFLAGNPIRRTSPLTSRRWPSQAYSPSQIQAMNQPQRKQVKTRAVAAETSTETTELDAPEVSAAKEQFSWTKQWYPLAIVQDLDPKRPTPVYLLGRRLVIWRDGNGQWSTMLDLCPHRLAPLSEGRISESGNLQCSYHGWEFGASGDCKRIPQLPAEESVKAASKRACVTTLPSKVHLGIVWAWADETCPEVAAETPLPEIPELEDPDFIKPSFQRDIHYSYDTLVENVMDPAHVPFAHHGIQGNREKAVPIGMDVTESTPTKIRVDMAMSAARKAKSWYTFTPPSAILLRFGSPAAKEGEKDKSGGLFIFAVPTRPGWCRVIGFFPRNFLKVLNRPRWMDHLERNAVLDGDMVFLHQQERILRDGKGLDGAAEWASKFYIPASSDRALAAFRVWLNRYGGGSPEWHASAVPANWRDDDLPPETMDRSKVMDRFAQHTEICSSCKTALTNIQKARNLLIALGIACLAVAPVMAVKGASRLALALPAAGVGMFLVALALYLVLEKRFFFRDYLHFER